MRQLGLEGRAGVRRRTATLLLTGAILVGGLAASSPAQAAPRDNLANARLCLRDGWKTLKTANGRAFRNVGTCVVYALFGGDFATPTSPPTVPPPTDGGGF
jgi:hypothetical protein